MKEYYELSDIENIILERGGTPVSRPTMIYKIMKNYLKLPKKGLAKLSDNGYVAENGQKGKIWLIKREAVPSMLEWCEKEQYHVNKNEIKKQNFEQVKTNLFEQVNQEKTTKSKENGKWRVSKGNILIINVDADVALKYKNAGYTKKQFDSYVSELLRKDYEKTIGLKEKEKQLLEELQKVQNELKGLV